jgi:hypothetical protein
MWRDQRRTAKSWSVRLDVDEMEDHWWEKQGVSTMRHHLTTYILALRRACLEDWLDSFYAGSGEGTRHSLAETYLDALLEPLSSEDSWSAISRGVPAKYVSALLEDEISGRLSQELVEELKLRKRSQTQATVPADD